MNYKEVLDFLYTQLPMYQRVGKVAFKKDLTNTLLLSEVLDHPHSKFKSIHVAGTNGKGSTSHIIASILQTAGYKVGLYTSPHLKSFRERIRINGEEVDEQFIVDFVTCHKADIEKISPSFFEITVIMAFEYFAQQEVDFAVIETGLGGRLDSTNIITPILSVITSISMDHQDMLGDTIESIAKEKAGIIKDNIPMVIGQLPESAEKVIREVGSAKGAEVIGPNHDSIPEMDYISDLATEVVNLNIGTVTRVSQALNAMQISISDEHFRHGLANVVANTGIKGRWQTLSANPLTICDVGHNEEAVSWLMEKISNLSYNKLHIVWGAVVDKSIDKILPLLIKDATYYFCAAAVPRAMDAEALWKQASPYGLEGTTYATVDQAYQQAINNAGPKDLIFVGGSTFVVAEIKDI
ncbi:MAG: folylpolyglutamate synthase/dihydrofolate synthase family protein [Reichenbachiella sp.]|uniref:bifunctional folylpolyglutamate synthase/dihydrofolate synthase n=1 Tax=Reichenbachiella sp. TaxID=2184521 RepID=UPI003265065F